MTATLLLTSCQAPEPPQATYNLPSHHDLFRADVVLTPSDDAQVLMLMRDAVPSDSPATIATARYGTRWRDVDSAVRWGSGVISMAVLSSALEPAKPAQADQPAVPERWTYRIITAADDPVTLIVTREPPPTIYALEVTAGLFGDRRDIEERLEREVHAAMRLFGAKPLPSTFDD